MNDLKLTLETYYATEFTNYITNEPMVRVRVWLKDEEQNLTFCCNYYPTTSGKRFFAHLENPDFTHFEDPECVDLPPELEEEIEYQFLSIIRQDSELKKDIQDIHKRYEQQCEERLVKSETPTYAYIIKD